MICCIQGTCCGKTRPDACALSFFALITGAGGGPFRVRRMESAVRQLLIRWPTPCCRAQIGRGFLAWSAAQIEGAVLLHAIGLEDIDQLALAL